jgi:C-terminal processing protease CtpA/Prc
MNDSSFRETYSDVFGKHHDKKALVVDTRFNGGGWLHDDLVTFLSGRDYIQFYPRKQGNLGSEPQFKWSKPSIVLMGEGNYSDAHMFPFAYKTLGIGKLVGMPVPGTGTAVWWEYMIDPTVYFGIPQVGMLTSEGKYLENTQLEPDFKVENPPEKVAIGEDDQLRKAVEILLSESDKNDQ